MFEMKCPHCGEMILASRWTVCPNCGYVIHRKAKKSKSSYKRVRVIVHPPGYDFKRNNHRREK